MGAGRALRWVLVELPVRFLLAAESRGGAVPLVWFAGCGALSVVGGGAAAWWAALAGGDPGQGFVTGLLAGPVALAALGGQGLLVAVVLWAQGRSLDDVLPGAGPRADRGRRAAPAQRSWHRVQARKVAPAVAGFFGLMTVMLVLDAGTTHWSERRFTGPQQVTQAQIVRYDDGPLGLGHRRLVVKYDVPNDVLEGRVRADDVGDEVGRIPDPGAALAVEYLLHRPSVVRPAGTAHRNADDARSSAHAAAICAALAAAAVAAHTLSRRRHRGR